MYYKKIKDPNTGNLININSKLGKNILKNYIFRLREGGSESKVIKKNDIEFYIIDEFSKKWYTDDRVKRWEPNTFNIISYYSNNKDGIYIDIGAWIGVTVLYAASLYKKVIAIEPDPVAIERLKKNMSANKCDNIIVVEKGLSDTEGKKRFGGNGLMGNSMSTLLVERTKSPSEKNTTTIDTITINTLINQLKINPSLISLIKMDIEGGEIILVPAIKKFLKDYKPVFYISLHRNCLNNNEIEKILDDLFNIYNKCYIHTRLTTRKEVTKEMIQKKKYSTIVFE